MILWLPISILLGFFGSSLMMVIAEMYSTDIDEILGTDEDDEEELLPLWAKKAIRGSVAMVLSIVAAGLMVACYLLAKLALGL